MSEKKFDIKGISKNIMVFSKEKLEEGKTVTTTKIIPTIKDTAIKTKDNVSTVVTKVQDKVKTSITEEQMQDILNNLYIKSIDGIPKVSLPVDDLVEDYMSKNKDIESAVKSLINNSTIKCGTSGFITGFGGFATMIATLPANITSVMYVQLRMCVAIAKMAGYDIHSDQVQTLIYACLTGSAAADILKQSGIKFGAKFGKAMVTKIPGKTLTAINQKVGFRFITKFGETGIVNLGKVVPVLGAAIGGGIDVASTRTIGKNAYNIFVKEEMPSQDEEKNDIIEANYEEIDDIDKRTLEEALKCKEYDYRITDEVYNWIINKKKNIEIRLLNKKSESIKNGDFITFYNISNQDKFIRVVVKDKKTFDNVEDLLKVYEIDNIMPGCTKNDLNRILYELYGKSLEEGKIVAILFNYMSCEED